MPASLQHKTGKPLVSFTLNQRWHHTRGISSGSLTALHTQTPAGLLASLVWTEVTYRVQGGGGGHSPGWGFSVLYRCPSPLSTEALLATVRDSPHQPQTASCDQAQQLGHAGLARWSPRTATQCPHPCSGPRPSSLQPPAHPLMGISPVSRTGCHPRETVAGHISLMGDSTPGG